MAPETASSVSRTSATGKFGGRKQLLAALVTMAVVGLAAAALASGGKSPSKTSPKAPAPKLTSMVVPPNQGGQQYTCGILAVDVMEAFASAGAVIPLPGCHQDGGNIYAITISNPNTGYSYTERYQVGQTGRVYALGGKKP
jgi:hypothetical protein